MAVSSKTPLLDTVHSPKDLKQLKPGRLRQLADELRQETIDAVAVTGGHLGAGLGVIELTVALHYVFDAPTGGAIDMSLSLRMTIRREFIAPALFMAS